MFYVVPGQRIRDGGFLGRCTLRNNVSVILGLLALAVALSAALPACDTGCDESDSAYCFQAPNEWIEKFEVTITTGNDPTTSDIFFCHQRKSTAGWYCKEMDRAVFYNDFAIGATDTYKLKLDTAIAPGDLERIRIGLPESDNHHDWAPTALTVVVVTDTGGEYLIYHDEDINCDQSVDEGYSYWPRECPY